VCRGDVSAEQIARARVPFGVLSDRRLAVPAVFPFGTTPRLRFLRLSRTGTDSHRLIKDVRALRRQSK
jgi:hypothetical protein